MEENFRLQYYCDKISCLRLSKQQRICSVAKKGQKRQAEKMLSDTAKYLPSVSICDNIRVVIPKVDREKLGDKHILGVVIDISGIYYTIGTSEGIINRKYSREEFELWNGSTFLNASNIPKHEISMHTLAKSFSLGRRNSCQCKGKCTTDHCCCKRSGYPCTSSCHSKVRGKSNNSSTIMQLSTESKLKKAPSILPEIYRNQYEKEHSSINRNLTNTEYLEVNSSDCEQQDSMETVDKNRESWFYTEMERMCVSWGGDDQGINLCNTCSIDNFLTLISLNLQKVQKLLILLEIQMDDDLIKMIYYIQMKKFNQLKFWLAGKMNVKCANREINFFGSEYSIIQILVKVRLSTQRYECTFKCPQCFGLFSIKESISYFTTFITNCQTTIDSKLIPQFCKLCKWEGAAFEKVSSKFSPLSPLLFIEPEIYMLTKIILRLQFIFNTMNVH